MGSRCLIHHGAGIAGIFALAKQYDTTTGVINNMTSKYVFTVNLDVSPVLTLLVYQLEYISFRCDS